jgi:hypothetical protein
MGNLLFWLGIGAAQKGTGSNKRTDSRHPVVSFVIGKLIARLLTLNGQPSLLAWHWSSAENRWIKAA